MNNRQLKKILDKYDDDTRITIFIEAEDIQDVFEFEGVGEVENKSAIFFYGKEFDQVE